MGVEIDWNSKPYVTWLQLADMPPWRRGWFLAQPNVWRPARDRDVLMNCAHPDNRDWVARDLIRQASH